jgi:Zn-dependent protease with chaperone function
MPVIWILPEFSPNALLLRSGRRLHVVLTEGSVRALGAEELDSLLALCLAHGYQRGKRLQTRASIWLFPVARVFQGYSASLQLLLFPFASLVLRLFARPQRYFLGDAKAARYCGGLLIAASLQKLSVLGAKIPVRNWNFALDGLFLVSPLALEQSPWTLFPSQPSIEERRRRILGGIACESAPSLT